MGRATDKARGKRGGTTHEARAAAALVPRASCLVPVDSPPAPLTLRGSKMATKLDKPIKRELELDGKLYTVTISPEGIKVVEKGKRKGQEVSWRSVVPRDEGSV